MRSCLALVLIGLGAACGRSSDPVVSIPNPPPSSGGLSRDYMAAANLNFAAVGQPLEGFSRNVLTIKGTGKKSTYKYEYRFNSGDADSFKVLTTSRSTKQIECGALPDADLSLIGPEGARDVSIINKLTIRPHADYILEISNTQDCARLELTFDVVPWIGSAAAIADPRLSRVCRNTAGDEFQFFNINLVSGYKQGTRYTGLDMFCGERFSGTSMNCQGISTKPLDNFQFFFPKVACDASTGADNRSSLTEFDLDAHTGKITCSKNGTVFAEQTLQACYETVLDFRYGP